MTYLVVGVKPVLANIYGLCLQVVSVSCERMGSAADAEVDGGVVSGLVLRLI